MTVEQARSKAQNSLAEARQGRDRGAAKTEVCMALTAQRAVATFMNYVHTEDRAEREASDAVAKLRKLLKRSPELLEKLEAA